MEVENSTPGKVRITVPTADIGLQICEKELSEVERMRTLERAGTGITTRLSRLSCDWNQTAAFETAPSGARGSPCRPPRSVIRTIQAFGAAVLRTGLPRDWNWLAASLTCPTSHAVRHLSLARRQLLC